MTDIFTRERRSEIMSRIPSNGTIPEERLFEAVRSILGPRWRIDRNVNSLPGRPDIVIPSLKVAVFLDGCFYHRCPVHGRDPKTNREYWVPKLANNVRRDRRNRRALRRMGFSVLRFWEHDLKPRTSKIAARRLERELISRIKSARAKRNGGSPAEAGDPPPPPLHPTHSSAHPRPTSPAAG